MWFHRKRNAQRRKPDLNVRQFDQFKSIDQVFHESSVMTVPSPRKSGTIPVYSSPHVTRPHTSETVSTDNTQQSLRMSSTQFPVGSSSLHGQHSSVNPPAASVRRSKGHKAMISSKSHSFNWPGSSGQSTSTHSRAVQGDVPAVTSENEVVYQHQDAGQVVRELPPPYILPPETG